MKKLLALLLALTVLSAVPALAEGVGQAVPAMEMSLEEYRGDSGRPTASPSLICAEPFVPENVEKAFVNPDDAPDNRPDIYPFTTVGNMFVHAACGCEWNGTCFMVGPSGAMTAAHCLVCTEHGALADKVEIYFGYRSSKNYLYRYADGLTYWYGTDFENDDGTYGYDLRHEQWDYAYMKLQERVGDYTGWLGTRTALDSDVDCYFELACYRNNRFCSDWGRLTKLADESEYRFGITAGTQGDYSGSPVFDLDFYSLCIWTSRGETRGETCVRRITGDLVEEMRENGIFD